MGCDIHMHVEIKLDGKWAHWNAPHVRRDYDLFTLLANVRNCGSGIEPIAEPRGLPKNVTAVTKMASDYMGVEGHSHSWITRKELARVEEWWNDNRRKDCVWFEDAIMGGYLLGNGYTSTDTVGTPIQDVRLVFWFDN